MPRRLHKTLADYVAISISPALIMGLVGSLVFFLLEVSYEGQFEKRLIWILGCFVFAAVLIARISMEEGAERAAKFSAALAIVTGIAVNRFSDMSLLLNLGLLGVIWWCAHKLTWDCTLIDEQEDSSGQGLLQRLGLDGEVSAKAASAQGETPASEDVSEELWGVTSRNGEPDSEEDRADKQAKKKKSHTPGLWVIYFSLAALPLFGLGQKFIPASDEAGRRWAFLLLCVYTACGLGLLLTTSFLGLRRYLRQRRVEMPPAMAAVWVGAGAVLIVALLGLASVLPRPSAEYEVAEFSLRFGSPEGLKPSDYALWREEGVEDKEASSRGEQSGQESNGEKGEKNNSDDQTDSGESQSKDGQGQRQGSGQSQQSGAQKGKQDEQSSGGQDGQSRSSQGKSGDSQSQSQAAKEPSGKGAKGEGSSGETQSEGRDSQSSGKGASQQQQSESEGESSSGKSPQQSQQSQSEPPTGHPGEKAESRGEKGQQQSSDSPQRRGKDERPSQARKQDSSQSERQGQSRQQQQSATNERQATSQQNESNGQRANEQSSAENRRSENNDDSNSSQAEDKPSRAGDSRKRTQFSPMGALRQAAAALGGLLKIVFWIALAAILAWLLWRYRDEVKAACTGFLNDLRKLWERLFGAGAAEAEEAKEQAAPTPPPPPFSAFSNPFADGSARTLPPEQLVRHSFEAFEAWARERGCQRRQDQTAYEFSQTAGAHFAALTPHIDSLARLYAQAAYGKDRLAPENVQSLERLWDEMSAQSTAV